MAIKELKPYLKKLADTFRSKLSINPNLFDVNTYPLTINQYIVPTSGTVVSASVSSALACTRDFMPCTHMQGKTYIINHTNGYSVGIAFYDENKTFTSGVTYKKSVSTPQKFTVPNDAIYFRISVDSNYIDEIKLEEGTHATAFVPFDYEYGNIDAQDFSNKIEETYNKGFSDSYNSFWDAYQEYGTRTFYSQGFSGYGWTDETFNPKYPIITNAATNRANSMFAYAFIENLMTPLYLYDTTNNGTFTSMTKCVRIGDDTGGGLWVTRNRVYNSNFGGLSQLKEIRFIDYNEKGEYIPSEIGKSISFSGSPLLSVSSMINIIAHLVDYSIESPGTNTLTFHADCWTMLESSERTPQTEGIDFTGTWREYVSSLGWNT